jgi:hypothetical protein
MKILSTSGLFVGVLLSGLLAAAPASATGYCQDVCQGGAYCTTPCLACNGINSGPDYPDGTCANPVERTCGNAGYQCTQGTCTPNWVATSSTPVGGFAEQSLDPPGCWYHGVSMVTYHDQNNCGQADYQQCQVTVNEFRTDYQCCNNRWCGGNTCGFD